MGGESGASFSLSSLLSRENESCLKGVGKDNDEHTNARSEHKPRFFVSEDEEGEFVRELVRREDLWFGSGPDTASSCVGYTVGDDWLRSARLDAIEWILNTRVILDFQCYTAYLSICYFDRFLSRRSIDEGKSWAIRLLSVACLSVAAKMEECNVPPLSEFPSKDYVFESKVIQRMELLVLSTLEWKMGLVTPFAYMHFFISKFVSLETIPKGLMPRAVEFLLAITKEINLMDYRPSVIAAAAVLAASDSRLARKDLVLKIGVISSWVFQENECVLSCYHLMQKLEMRKNRTPESLISQKLKLTYSTSSGVVENSCIESGAVTKRRLSFDDSDQNFSTKRMHRP